MNSKIDALFKLGVPGEAEPWPDYRKYGFNEEDVPGLLSLVAERGIEEAAWDLSRLGVSVHAWRVLGQVGSRDAVAPLIDLFGLLCEDEQALMEIPVVMAMFGEPSMVPLESCLRDPQLPEYARAMAAESLKEIALKLPEHKARVVKGFIDYLRDPDTAALLFNALVVAVLVDLEAAESIEVVRALYERELADIRFTGDIEDVEIGFGLRKTRSTPEPYPSAPEEPSKPEMTPENAAAIIDQYLDYYGHDDSIQDISELDGFFTAIGCAPELIKPTRWQPAVWGGTKGTPAWQDEEEARTFTTALMVAYNEAITSLSKPSTYKPVFEQREEDGKTQLIVDNWCGGFLRGYKLWQPLKELDLMAMDEQLQPMRLFASEEGVKHRDTLDDKEVEKWRQRIEPAIGRIYQMFSQQRESVSRPVYRVAPKVGRNDPCPCGSGKKYKNCCLQ